MPTEVFNIHMKTSLFLMKFSFSSWTLPDFRITARGEKGGYETCHGWYPASIACSQYPVYQDILISISSYPSSLHIPLSLISSYLISLYDHIFLMISLIPWSPPHIIKSSSFWIYLAQWLMYRLTIHSCKWMGLSVEKSWGSHGKWIPKGSPRIKIHGSICMVSCICRVELMLA